MLNPNELTKTTYKSKQSVSFKNCSRVYHCAQL